MSLIRLYVIKRGIGVDGTTNKLPKLCLSFSTTSFQRENTQMDASVLRDNCNAEFTANYKAISELPLMLKSFELCFYAQNYRVQLEIPRFQHICSKYPSIQTYSVEIMDEVNLAKQ